jgi:RNA polymerase sigma-70 factor (ECF subfamily)
MNSAVVDKTEPDPVMRELEAAQLVLFSYICMLTGNSQDAHDILQETNLRLCKEAAKYDPARPFIAWAKTLAVYEVMTYRKRQRRDRLVFDDDIFENIAAQAESQPDETECRLAVLETCVRKLPILLRSVVEARYFKGIAVHVIAQRLNRSSNAVSLLLMRARQFLAECIKRAVAQEGTP